MKEHYVCDTCKKMMAKDEANHVVGSKGHLYLCDKCLKKYKRALDGK